jgi:hypothetical protein
MFRHFFILTLVFVTTTLVACTDDPANGAENIDPGCEDECALGDRSCIDSETVEFCVPDSTTGCNRLIDTQCLTSEECVQGTCDELPRTCEDVCRDLDTRCTVEGQVETCADHDGDGCVEFGDPVDCPSGEFCQARDGLCRAAECFDECEQGTTSCEGELISTCVRNAQGCLEYGPAKECAEGQTCQSGECVGGAACTDECSSGQAVCTGDGQRRECGDFDDDTCLELGPAAACPGGQVCREGVCETAPTCTDDCRMNEAVCVGNQISECVTGASGCLEFTSPMACPGATESCTVENGSVACRAAPVAGPVVINEVFFDALGDDVRPGGSPTFIELRGPAGLDLSAYVLEMVNGSSSGGTYNSVTLPAGARLDGNGFAVVTLDNPDTYLGLEATQYTNVYSAIPPYASGQDGLQNGPDNVRLLDDTGAELDAVGYGSFGANNTFVGEGSAAPEPVVAGRSIGRRAGVDTDDNSADFISFYPTPGLPNSDLLINEVYVDQPGSDDGSETFVELVAPIIGWEDADLTRYTLRAVNGFNGDDYIQTGVIPGILMQFLGIDVTLNDDQAGYVVICNADVASSTLFNVCSVDFDGVDFQNGPDNFVLEFDGRVVDAIGYGSFSGSQTFVGEGSPAPFSSSDAGKSLSRWPVTDRTRDVDTDDNATDFSRVSPTPGRENARPAP